MPLILLAPLAVIVLAATGLVTSAVRGTRRARHLYRDPGADPSAILLAQSELNRPEGHAPGHHQHAHHHHHHRDPNVTGGWNGAPGNAGGIEQPHHHHNG